jgi:glycerophosphoryl diester phosphodiesterase
MAFWLTVMATAAMAGVAGPKTSIAHRGASAYAPEHTRAAYELAIAQGADYVEQDLAVTSDGQLVCIHDDSLERTTDVEEVFPDRFTTDANGTKRWMVADFTLDEVKRLDAGRWFDAKFAGERVLTWQEAVKVVNGRAGLYPELKSPGLYKGRRIDMVALFVAALRGGGLDKAADSPRPHLIVQSFDADAIKSLSSALPAIPRVLLVGDARGAARWLSDEGLKEVRGFATGIGPAKQILEARPEIVKAAHAAGLTVTPYTFRSQNTGRFADVRAEMDYFLNTLGVDALFTDNPDRFPR